MNKEKYADIYRDGNKAIERLNRHHSGKETLPQDEINEHLENLEKMLYGYYKFMKAVSDVKMKIWYWLGGE